MAFWTLAILTVLLSFARFKPLRKHVGATRAIAISALRLLALAIAGSLAAPILVSSSQSITLPNRVAILVDASQSTNTPERLKVIKQLRQELQHHTGSVSVFEFAEVTKSTSLKELSEHPKGTASCLSEAILKVAETVKPNELLVVSDAQDTNPQPYPKVYEALKKAETRLNAVLLPTYLPPNLSVSLSPAQAFLFAGEKVSFAVQVKSKGLPGVTRVKLRVWDANKLLFQSRLTIATGTEQTTVTLTPQEAGWHRYRFEVSLDGNEAWTADNVAEALVWRAPTKLRVLLVTGQPNFEFKFVKQAIESEPNFEWVAVASLPDKTRYQQGSPQLMPASLTRPEKFHVVVVIAPTADEFSAVEGKALWQFAQVGGGLLLTLNELTVRTNGWRFFIPYPLTFTRLPSPAALIPSKEDLLGSRFSNLPEVDTAWAVGLQSSFAHIAVRSSNKPVLIWWQEGLGKIAVLGLDGTWRWVMEAARKGEAPSLHRQFWQTTIRFLADPTKGFNRREDWMREKDLITPTPPPEELTVLPNTGQLLSLVKATGGQVLQPSEVASWLRNLAWTRREKVEVKRPISTMPLPYLLLLAALTVEWWLVRRSGLQ